MDSLNISEVLEYVRELAKNEDFTGVKSKQGYDEPDSQSRGTHSNGKMYRQKGKLCELIIECNDISKLAYITVFVAIVCDKQFTDIDTVENMCFELLEHNSKFKEGRE